MQKQLLADYAPASVLINRKFEVLCFQGPTVDYLEFPSGEPTRDLLALARQGLRTRLRALVSEAIQTGEPVTDAVPRVKRDGHYLPCKLTVKPFAEPEKPERPVAGDLRGRARAPCDPGPRPRPSRNPRCDPARK